jgi:pimeloyl-ACP methyl ester carboxylesterase
MIPFTDFGGVGPQLHFLHANGYPPACYLPLLTLLRQHYSISSMHLRPLWPGSKPNEIGSWNPLTDDLRLFLDENKLIPVIGAGHSIGAIVTLRTALRNPNYFRALILIDPVLFSPQFIATWNLVKTLGLETRLHPLISSTLKRRNKFDDLEQLFTSYRNKKIFRYFSDDALRNYISGIVKENQNGGFELAYSPEWEARIYYTGVWRDMDLWWGLPNLKVPTIIIRGAETDTFLKKTANHVQHIRPSTKIVTIEKSTHLVPLEQPQETNQFIQEFLKEVL